jgi:hypothetical protein
MIAKEMMPALPVAVGSSVPRRDSCHVLMNCISVYDAIWATVGIAR